jgi:hypothetical protein
MLRTWMRTMVKASLGSRIRNGAETARKGRGGQGLCVSRNACQ